MQNRTEQRSTQVDTKPDYVPNITSKIADKAEPEVIMTETERILQSIKNMGPASDLINVKDIEAEKEEIWKPDRTFDMNPHIIHPKAKKIGSFKP